MALVAHDPVPALIEDPSPNFGPRRNGGAVELILLHYTAMGSGAAALARLKDPAAEVSAHYFIAEEGVIRRLVPDAMRAWHAGAGSWRGLRDVNSRSIGIELDHRGHDGGSPPFPEVQMQALERLLAWLMARHGLPPEAVLAHSDIAPERKADPGEKFDWRRLWLRGLSIWLDPSAAVSGVADPVGFQEAARRFGYAVPESGVWCGPSLAVLEAFRRRFLPAAVGQPPRAADVAHMQAIAARWPVSG